MIRSFKEDQEGCRHSLKLASEESLSVLEWDDSMEVG
jgi:hypothetical protein